MESADTGISQSEFFDYTVYSIDNCHSFTHAQLNNEDNLYRCLSSFFLDENRLIQYVENDRAVHFNQTSAHIAEMYKRLSLFAAKPNYLDVPRGLSEGARLAIESEYKLVDNGLGSYVAMQPAVGRLGEYFLHVFLSEYFQLDCVVPKIDMTTDPNMSVFGIDSLFFSAKESMIYFGEAKFSKALTSGVSLLRESLNSYEKQIGDEFKLIFSARHIKRHPEFERLFGEAVNESCTFEEFSRRSGLTSICVPMFVAHGDESAVEPILTKLAGLPCKQLFGLQTAYWGISLPVISKQKLVDAMMALIQEKMTSLEYARNE